MKKLLYFSLISFVLSSCTHDVYRVIKYSDFDKDNEDYSDYFFPKEEYYVIKNSNYYYVKSDTVLHFRKISYLGKKHGLDRTLVKTDNGTEYFLDAYIDVGYYNDEYVYVDVLNPKTKEKLYRFVLDWKHKMENVTFKERIANLQ
jgi:hypothetical protein